MMIRLNSATLPLIPEIQDYLSLVETDRPRQSRDQHALVRLIKKIIDTEIIYIDRDRLQKYISLERYFPWKLFPWQKFLLALWLCTYRDDQETPRFKTCFGLLSRGGGKDGFIAFCSMCLLSPYNPVPRYDVDICAAVEEQATRPVADLVDVLESPAYQDKLGKYYHHTKELVRGRKNLGTMKGRTSNPKSKDGMRSGAVIFNEVHAYENYRLIKVFRTGLGKVAEPRIGVFSSNGEVSDGPLDDYIAQAERILFEDEDDRGFLPFVCRIPKKEDVDDPDNWSMANPSWEYLPTLRQETADEYHDWKQHPEQNGDFLSKRMGLRAGFTELSVTDYEKVLATKQPIPDLKGWTGSVGIDYAELSDWAAVVLHFRNGDQRYDICHTWICADSKTLSKVQAPWEAWVAKGYCTLVRKPSIPPELLAQYIKEIGKIYHIRRLAMDNFRWALLSKSLGDIGFDASDKDKVKLVRPSDIMRTEPVIQYCFDNQLFHWGDYPPLRWAVNNTKRVPSSKSIGADTGNFYYAKIEAKSRKTDPWMALVAAMTCEDVLGSVAVKIQDLPPVFDL